MNKEDLLAMKLHLMALTSNSSAGDAEDDCPDDEAFMLFMEGKLASATADRLARHVATCPRCHLAYTALRETEVIDGPPVPAHLIKRARELVSPPLAAVVLKMLKGALQVISFEGVELSPSMGLSAEPAQLRGEGDAGASEVVEIASPTTLVETISLQKIEPADVRISICPSPTIAELEKTFRIDLWHGDVLVQSWPLEQSVLALEPVSMGQYRLSVMEFETARGVDPLTAGTIDIEVQA